MPRFDLLKRPQHLTVSGARICFRYLFVFFIIIRANNLLHVTITGIPSPTPAQDEPPSTMTSRQRNHNISVVVMNHMRPKLLQSSSLLRTFSEHPAVDEILLLHTNPSTAFSQVSFQTTKLQHIDAATVNGELGLATRFHYCETAQNPWVIIVDDDVELKASAITQVSLEMYKNPRRIVGRYGRSGDIRGNYNMENFHGPVELVLTKFLIAERIVCEAFGKYRDLVDDLAQNSTPKWNGEDIFFNLVANHIYRVPENGPYMNMAMEDLAVWDSKLMKRFIVEKSISGKPRSQQRKLHLDQRSRMLKLGKERLAALEH